MNVTSFAQQPGKTGDNGGGTVQGEVRMKKKKKNDTKSTSVKMSTGGVKNSAKSATASKQPKRKPGI